MKKTLFTIIILLFWCCMLCSCVNNQTPERVLIIGNKESLDEDTFVTVTNDTENERFVIKYEARGENKDFETFFSFSFYGNGERLWSTLEEVHDESVPLVLSCEGGKELTGDPTRCYAYDIKGETTVYVSYAGLSEELKNKCKSIPWDTYPDAFSISVNSYTVAHPPIN